MRMLSKEEDLISPFLNHIGIMNGEISGITSIPTTSTGNSNSGLLPIALSIINCEDKNKELDFEVGIHLLQYIIKLEHLQNITEKEFSIYNISGQCVRK